MDTANQWKIIHAYFEDNPQALVAHHLESYNDFFKNGIFQIFKEKNPVSLSSVYDENLGDFKHQCHMYLGGKDGSRIYFGKPVIYDEKQSHYMFPNEARLRNMTYGMTVHYDIEIEFLDLLEPGESPGIVTEGVAEFRGGAGFSEEKEVQSDYPMPTAFHNFKTGGESEHEEEVQGGAPKKPRQETRRKVTRDKRQVKPFQMTPALAAAIREATEKSLHTSDKGRSQKRTIILPKVYLGKFPIMLHSDYCVLKGLPPEIRHTMGECRSDLGGYFLIQGLEKTVVTQEKFADNMLWVRKGKETLDEDGNMISATDYLYSADIRSVSENVSKPIRNLSVQIVAPTASYTNQQMVVNVPNVRKPVPLFVLFRALGIVTDKAIIEMCLLDLDKYEHMIDTFVPSVHDAGSMMTQSLAIEYIASLTKGKRTEHALEILSDYFLPHIGETNYTEKAHFLGHMVFRLLSVSTGLETPTDRDNFKYKRLELVGTLMYDLFREYYNLQLKHIQVKFEERLLYSKILYEKDLPLLIQTFHDEVFKTRVVEAGFKKAFKGNWGAAANTKRVGIVQDINRLSYNTYLSHLRKTNLPMDAGSNLVEPRKLHCSQWGYIDPIDTPDGGNIGLHKSLAILTHVTRGGQNMREPIVQWLREKISMKYVEECSPKMLANMTKIMLNGYWAGVILDPFDCVKKIKLFRRNALLPIFMSVTFEIKKNTIYMYTDAGRLSRPIFYRDEEMNTMSFEVKDADKYLGGKDGDIHWEDLTTGFNTKREDARFDPYASRIYELHELYAGVNQETNPHKIERFMTKKAPIDYLDCSESENALICLNAEQYMENPTKKFTHMEIHESLIFGNMCNLIVFPESNPPTRNSFSCGQSKQAVSMYHTNYQVRMDKTAVILNTGQTPVVKTRYLDYINHEENPYGVNAMVAIMCYTGYNVEDAVLINEASLKRGLFRTTYYTTYQAHEESSKNIDTTTDIKFANIESETGVVGTKPGYDYSQLDQYGVIKEGTEVNDKTVLIGLVSASSGDVKKVDGSKTTKKGQLGTVDKTFITEGEEGERIAKVRIREERVPNLGDKFASRSGQKGTVGLVIPEADMPFTKDGIRPDMIINPHALPSRMTVGHLVETLMGKACLSVGGFGDGTAFLNKGSKIGVFGEMLPQLGYHSSGNDILYNGMTGEQIEAEVFFGPTYYMRLKHMVKDKINYRALGPRTALTRQPVHGRANDGGLRIGEMERDSVMAHGITGFLTESMMERGDKYHMAVCNNTGMLAICNPAKNLFMSPMADGPIQFVGSLDGKEMYIENVTKFGRDFSVISIPYTMKLLMQELQCANIQMRIITEDSMPQLENMMFSKNIEKLMGLEGGANVDAEVKKQIQMKMKEPVENPEIRNIMANARPEMSPEIREDSPEWYVTGGAEKHRHKKDKSHITSVAIGAPLVEEELEETGAEEFQRGDLAYCRGDTTQPPRPWKILEISPTFTTIQQTPPSDNPMTPDLLQEIKVVRHSDLYRPSDADVIQQQQQEMYYPMENNLPTGPFSQELPMYYGPPQQAEPDTSKINFNPIINVVAGDNKGKIDFTAASSIPAAQEHPQNEAMAAEAQDVMVVGQEKKLENLMPSSGAPVDFSKLVVIKRD